MQEDCESEVFDGEVEIDPSYHFLGGSSGGSSPCSRMAVMSAIRMSKSFLRLKCMVVSLDGIVDCELTAIDTEGFIIAHFLDGGNEYTKVRGVNDGRSKGRTPKV